jgi:hypothetical protein
VFVTSPITPTVRKTAAGHARRKHLADVRPGRAGAAAEQDERERDHAEPLREMEVLERDAQHAFRAGHHAEEQEQQQAGDAES